MELKEFQELCLEKLNYYLDLLKRIHSRKGGSRIS